MLATNIDEVIGCLHQVIDTARREQSRLGYFAALYMHVATRVQECLEEQVFDNPAFIEQLNLTFFNCYFEALNQYKRGERPAASWLIAFEAAQSSRPTLEQHLLLGINAHINFDLGIAVAGTCHAPQLSGCQADYDKMTGVLLEVYEGVMRNLTAISPVQRILDQQLRAPKASLVHYGLLRARQHAWNVAVRLAGMSSATAQAREIALLDRFVTGLGQLIWQPNPLLGMVSAMFRLNEHGSVSQIIDLLLAKGYGRRHPHRQISPRRSRPPTRKRVVVLGGGIAALTTAFELTDPYHNPHHNEYDVTVYQIGWRLGGKGASGRSLDPALHYRIEEHGLHAWFGFYDNAFDVIKRCYAQLSRPDGAPLAHWYDAFKPISVSALVSRVAGKDYLWPIRMPTNSAEPGDGDALLPLRDYVAMALRLLRDYYRDAEPTRQISDSQRQYLWTTLPPQARAMVNTMSTGVTTEAQDMQMLSAAASMIEAIGQRPDEPISWFGEQPTALAQAFGKSVDQLLHSVSEDLHDVFDRIIVQILETFIDWLWYKLRTRVATDVESHRLWIVANFIYANVRGIIEDDLFSNGFDAINQYDYREWLGMYAHPDGDLMVHSEVAALPYDSSFAYLDGQPRFEAGTALRGMIRSVFTYKGAFGWKMQAGTGDVVFAPLYEVLRRRGVTFKFFHKVKRLEPTDDASSIARIVLGQQVQLQSDTDDAGRADEYHPLINVKGLPCWPSQPLYEQIVDGERLKQAGVNLESPLDPTEVAELTLEQETDFDMVVLGISLGGLPTTCSALIDKSSAWQAMTRHVKTTATQALQLWLRRTASQLGWPEPGQPIMTFNYNERMQVNPLNSWGNLSQVIERECWPNQHYPLSVAYFCSALADADLPDPDAHVKRSAIELLERYIRILWPNSAGTLRDPGFDWSFLVDTRPRSSGARRLDSQYWRANTLQSERYVLSVPDSSRFRLHANNPGEFANLFLAGDWTANGLNCGCMEAATVSGRLAAAAISGYPLRHMINGVDF